MSENELDLNYYTNEPPQPITHEMFNKLIKQRDQYKAENEKLKTELDYAYKNWKAALNMGNSIAEEKSKADEENENLEQIRDFKDSALKGADIKIKTLEQENEKYRIRAENAMELTERANCEVLRLERENEKLKDKLKD